MTSLIDVFTPALVLLLGIGAIIREATTPSPDGGLFRKWFGRASVLLLLGLFVLEVQERREDERRRKTQASKLDSVQRELGVANQKAEAGHAELRAAKTEQRHCRGQVLEANAKIEILRGQLAFANRNVILTLQELSATKAELRRCREQLVQADTKIDGLRHTANIASQKVDAVREEAESAHNELQNGVATAIQKLDGVQKRLSTQNRPALHADGQALGVSTMSGIRRPADQKKRDVDQIEILRRGRRNVPWERGGLRARDLLAH